MTTGLIEIGALGTAYYYRKAWTGSDGISSENAYEMTVSSHARSQSSSGYSWDPCLFHPSGLSFRANASAVQGVTWTNNDTIKLNGKLSAKMKGHDFNAGIAIGEGRETIQLVSNTVKSLAKSVRDIKRGNVDGALRHLTRAASGPGRNRPSKPTDSFSLSGLRSSVRKAGRQANGELHLGDVSSTWLALQYGWKPLLQDIKNSAEAFEAISAPPRVNKIRVSHTIRKAGNPSASPSASVGTGKFTHTKRYTVTISESLSVPRSLGLLDPLAVAWELVPFSFVADWFLPIGSYFEAVSGLPPHVDTVVTLGEKIEKRGLLTPASVLPNTGLCPIGYYSKYHEVWVKRTPGYGVTTPPPNLKSVSEAMSVPRLSNAIALAHQVFR